VAERSIRSRLLTLVVALCALGGLAHFAVRFISTGPLRTLVEKDLSEALGLAVSLDELEVALFPMPHLHAEGLRVANLPDRSSPHLLSIDRIEFEFELWPLLDRKLVVSASEIAGADLYVETNAEGRLAGHFDLGALVNDADEDFLDLEIRAVDIEKLRVFYRDGRSENSYSLILESAALKSKNLGTEIELDIRGEFEGSKFALAGRIGSLRELLKRTKPFPIDLRGDLFEANFAAKGVIHKPWAFKGFDVEISGEIPELIVQERPLPQLGAIDFGGHLSDLDGSLGLEQLRLDSSEPVPVRIAVHGDVDDLLALEDVDVEMDVETQSLDFLRSMLQPRVDFPLPQIEVLSVQAKLTDLDGSFNLDGSLHAVTPGGALVIHAEGGIHDLMRSPKLDLTLNLQADDLMPIAPLFPDAPIRGHVGPVKATGHLKNRGDILVASGLELRIGDREKVWVELDGSIGDVIQFQDVEFELAFGAESLHHLKEILERDLPRTSKFEGSAALSDKDGSLGLEHLRLHGGEDSPVEIHLEARLDDVLRRDEIEVELRIRGEDTRMLGAIAGLDLPVITPVEFHGKVKGSEKHIEVDGMTLRLGETRLLGTLSGAFAPDTRPKIHARLTSKDIRLQDLGLVPSEETPNPLTSIAQRRNNRSQALSFDDLRRIDLDLELRVDHLDGYTGLEAQNVGFRLRLDDGNLVVSDAGADYQGGKLNANLHVDARTPLPSLKAELRTNGLNIAGLVSQFREESNYSGILDIELELHARGDSFDSQRQSLAGTITASMRDGNAASRIAREFVVNLSEIVFPDIGSKKVPNIGCAVIALEIDDGIASVQTLLLRGKKVGVVGTGEIDLVRGVYDLHVVPKMENPGLLSVAPEVHVTGPLDDPKFTAMKRTLITSFGRGLFQNARAFIFPFGRKTREAVEPCRDPNSAPN
jgi:uncharacterized protein involved in outer membrane biogenesis